MIQTRFPTGLQYEREVRSKSKHIKEHIVIYDKKAASLGTIAFGDKQSDIGSDSVRALLISKSEFGLHIVCNSSGQVPLPWSLLIGYHV